MGDLGEDGVYESTKEFRAEFVAGARGVDWQIVAKRGQARPSQNDGGGDD